MARDWSTSTLRDRLQFLADLRGVTQNELGKRAGIASGPMSRLATKDVAVGGSLDSARKLSDAWDVPLEWLAFGRGSPFTTESAPADVVAERPTVIAMARQLGIAAQDRELYEAAFVALRARSFPATATRDEIQLALCEEIARAKDLRDRMREAAEPAPVIEMRPSQRKRT